jgi:Ca2+-binding EF-hand superfamily protein
VVEAPVSFLQSTFEQLDKEGRGVITKSVLKRATMITAEHYDRRIIREEIEKCDSQINYSRFVEIFEMANVGDGGVNEWLYALYDRAAKGFIDRADLARVAAVAGVELGEEEVGAMLATARNRGSGRVDYEDFKFIMEEEIANL